MGHDFKLGIENLPFFSFWVFPGMCTANRVRETPRSEVRQPRNSKQTSGDGNWLHKLPSGLFCP